MEIYKFYKLEWLPDGYPGRRTDKGLIAHPLYGAYVINDYLNAWKKGRDDSYLEGAKRVATAGLARMEEFEDALVFRYTPEMGLSKMPNSFYSALTQARWLGVLQQLADATRDPQYSRAAERVLASLAIPVERGGVAKSVAGGIAIEEWPHEVPTYTLNGWTTALNIIWNYGRKTGSRKAKELFEANIRALENLLPLYDLPELMNSRYQLAGFVWLKVRFEGADGRVSSASINIPGEGTYPVRTDTQSRWHNFFGKSKDDRTVMINAVLNYVSAPQSNVLELAVDLDAPGKLEVSIGAGDYDLSLTAVPVTRWETITSQDLAPGKDSISVQIPWESAKLVAYPTNFAKKIGGKNYNAYHFIHINNLRVLFQRTKSQIIKQYVDKWSSYVKSWPDHPLYSSAGVSLKKYSPADAR